jgi:hypothetical protein
MTQRNSIDNAALRELVIDRITELVANKMSFTAFDVTLALREQNPDTEIPHIGGVQDIVHEFMTDNLTQLNYRKTWEPNIGEIGAAMYKPTNPSVTHPSVPDFDDADDEDADDFDDDILDYYAADFDDLDVEDDDDLDDDEDLPTSALYMAIMGDEPLSEENLGAAAHEE